MTDESAPNVLGRLAGLLVVLAAAARVTSASADPGRTETVAWLRAHATPVVIDAPATGPDVEAIATMVRGTRIVSFGEATHGTHEYLAVRNRVIEYLIEHEGLRTVAFETGFREAIPIDDFLATPGEVDPPDSVVRAMMSWSNDGTGSGRRENRELLRWIRDFNAGSHAGPRVRLYGFDLSGRSAKGGFPNAATPILAAMDFVAKVDAPEAARFKARFGPALASFRANSYADKPYDRPSASARESLSATIADLARWLDARASGPSGRAPVDEIAAHAFAEASQLDHYFRINFGHGGMGDAAARCRDSTMAANIQWIADRSDRVFVFAHDHHVEKGSPGAMGNFLAASGVTMTVIGTADSERLSGPTFAVTPAPAQGSEGVGPTFTEVGLPAFAVDLRTAKAAEPVHAWLDQMRPVNPVSLVSSQLESIRLSRWFDVVVFIRTVHAGE